MSRGEQRFGGWWTSGLAIVVALAIQGAACSGEPVDPPGPTADTGPRASSSLVLTRDDSALWVVNPESDSVSVIDTKTRALLSEIPLAAAPPARDPVTKRFDPAVLPRSIALLKDEKAYVAGEMAGKVFVLDMAKKSVLTSIPVGVTPVSVVAAPDGSAVYVVSHEAAEISKIDPATDTVVATLKVGEHPWGINLSEDQKTLYVTHILLDPGVTVIDTATLAVRNKVPLADQAPVKPINKKVPNGVARGAYSLAPRPGTGELWVPHLLLAVKTPQPELDFESTVFPTISTLNADGSAEGRRLLFKPAMIESGAFADSVSGPRAVAFTPDGKLALVAMAQSEDVMVFDAEGGTQLGSVVRPIPSAMLDGIVVDHTGKKAYVDGRVTHDVTVLSIDESNSLKPVAVDGAPIERLGGSDPMPADLRLGMRLFYSANSSFRPITKNFWVACSSCHIEGGSDAVTWLFAHGPRDTPSNAGGPINTGFLFRQATRSSVQQYDETIRTEQGGSYHLDAPTQKADLDAMAEFVNYAIPFPPNPNLAPGGALNDAQKRGKDTFQTACASCHSGAYLTDSGTGNPKLDLSGTVLLHDIGTCVQKGDNHDTPATDYFMKSPRTACDFDTPTLRGIFATAPYFHDGSALTLGDVVNRLNGTLMLELSDAEKADLVAYLQTL